MNDKFFDLKKEKQDRMINAALKVFAFQGYKHASTDEIVREAAISKGLLFHYFGSKAGAYEFMYAYSVRYMLLELSAVDSEETDFYRLLMQIEGAKLQVLRNYPYMQQFLLRAAKEDDGEALEVIAEKREEYNAKYAELLDNVDWSGLSEEIDREKLLRIIDYTVRGIITDGISRDYNPDSISAEVKNYIAMFKVMTTKKDGS